MLWCKSSRPILVRACVSQSSNVFSVAAELRSSPSSLSTQSERDLWGKGRVVYVAFTSSRGPKSNDTRASSKGCCLCECSVDARWWSFFRCGSRGGRQRGVVNFCGEKPLPFFGEEKLDHFFRPKEERKRPYCEKSRKDDGFCWRFLVSRTTKSMTKI